MNKFLQPIFTALLIFGVFIFTRNEITGVFKLQITLLLLISLCIYGYLLKKRAEVATQKLRFIYLLLLTVLFLVGSTGWFFSPFFFILYLTTLLLAFVVSMPASLSFVLMLVLLFSFNIGEVDLAYDFLVVLSLLTTIPLSIYLRKEYLQMKQAKKEILVLKEEEKRKENIVDEVLTNKMHHFATVLRESINDAKTMAYHMKDLSSKKDIEEHRKDIIATTEKALGQVKEFEEATTGNKLMKTLSSKKISNF